MVVGSSVLVVFCAVVSASVLVVGVFSSTASAGGGACASVPRTGVGGVLSGAVGGMVRSIDHAAPRLDVVSF